MNELLTKAKQAKQAAKSLALARTEAKNGALALIAEQLQAEVPFILAANQQDVEVGRTKGLTEALLDRLTLTEARIEGMVTGLQQVIQLPDPIGESLERIQRPNGLQIEKIRVPLGVIGMIYEARPNVTVDASSLCLKAGNAVLLRGSSSALHSNQALIAVIHRALAKSELPVASIQLLEDTSRETAAQMFTLNQYLNVLIPRGGANLIQAVVQQASVPVLETGMGNCHLYIDDEAPVQMALDITINAKVQRPSVCNAAETILVHEDWAEKHLQALIDQLKSYDVTIYADERARQLDPSLKQAGEEDWQNEYLDLSVALKVVASLEEAIAHIGQYGTMHSEAIITANEEHARTFLNQVDAAAVYHNASTRFTDGFEFGFGAEIGISTQKLHARGPMGLTALTSMKYQIHGTGQIRG